MKLSELNDDSQADIKTKVLSNFGVDIDKANVLGSGTYATAYDAGQYALKLTKDFNDFKNAVKARRINSPNVIKVYKTAQIGKIFALLVDKVDGENAEYSTSEWHALLYGDSGIDELRTSSKAIMKDGGGIRTKVLMSHGKNTPEERKKLSELFNALSSLSSIGIHLDDLGDNIMDDGSKYIIVDLGM